MPKNWGIKEKSGCYGIKHIELSISRPLFSGKIKHLALPKLSYMLKVRSYQLQKHTTSVQNEARQSSVEPMVNAIL